MSSKFPFISSSTYNGKRTDRIPKATSLGIKLSDQRFPVTSKTSIMLHEWINEKSEAMILDEYRETPGILRNRLHNADWLLFIDADVLPQPDGLTHLLEIDRPLVGGYVPGRGAHGGVYYIFPDEVGIHPLPADVVTVPPSPAPVGAGSRGPKRRRRPRPKASRRSASRR